MPNFDCLCLCIARMRRECSSYKMRWCNFKISRRIHKLQVQEYVILFSHSWTHKTSRKREAKILTRFVKHSHMLKRHKNVLNLFGVAGIITNTSEKNGCCIIFDSNYLDLIKTTEFCKNKAKKKHSVPLFRPYVFNHHD